MSELGEQLIDRTVALLNEAVSLDPKLWALFDVMVPCATVVGHATPIEFMGVNPSLAMASCLGLLNGVLSDSGCRISIITENEGGRTRRVFARTTNAPTTVGEGNAELPEVHS
ncbi:hypothetical protein D3C85_478980 [compost metagenome]